jgi:hypothetical protein
LALTASINHRERVPYGLTDGCRYGKELFTPVWTRYAVAGDTLCALVERGPGVAVNPAVKLEWYCKGVESAGADMTLTVLGNA